MALTSSQIHDIDLKAAELLQSAYGSTNNVTIPVELERIVDATGIQVLEGNFPDDSIEGVLNRQEETVYVKAGSISQRKRFTAAHEFGHYYLHDDVNTEVFYRMDSMHLSADNNLEREANWFASSLLMPAEQVRQYWFLLRDVAAMADKFQVSITAMRWRLKNLGLTE